MALPGIEARLANDLSVSQQRVKIRPARKERKYSAFIGGCLLASRDDFESELCVWKDDYDEIGPEIVHQMCF